MNGTETIADTLSQAMAADAAVHILGEALPLSGAAAPMLAAHPERCHLLPAADASLVGIAIGIALSGGKPVVELSSTEALWGTLQQLGQESAALHGEFQGTLVIRVPVSPGVTPPPPLLADMPHIQVASPSSAADAGFMLKSALGRAGVTVLLEPLTVLSEAGGIAGAEGLSKANIVQDGEHITIGAWGAGVEAALTASRTLRAEGIEAEVIDLRSLAPLDTASLSTSVHKTGRLILVDGSAEMLRAATTSSFLRLESPPTLVGSDQIITQARAAIQF
jgi:pyruvate/2-oxoglutarate/acetoin dehydrogenase E1 component